MSIVKYNIDEWQNIANVDNVMFEVWNLLSKIPPNSMIDTTKQKKMKR